MRITSCTSDAPRSNISEATGTLRAARSDRATNDMRFEGWAFCIAALTAFPVGAAAVQAETEAQRTTAAGVFTEAQAKAGGDLYAGLCTGCHTMSSHTGVTFRKSWLGMPVSELFIYLSQSMPEDAPGSLSAKEYAQVVAYLLEMNGMPTGSIELPAEEGALRAIRIDTVAASRRR
jgi:mono/diheme cytochrome c family protein